MTALARIGVRYMRPMFTNKFQIAGETMPDMWGAWEAFSLLPKDLCSWRLRFIEPSRASLQITVAANVSSDQDDWRDDYGYSDFNHTQCDIAWELMDYDVKVNHSSKLIHNEPRPACSGRIMALQWLFICIRLRFWRSKATSTKAALNLNALHNATKDTGNETTLRATEDFVARLLDQANLNIQMTRMVTGAPNATMPGTAEVTFPALKFGDFRFVVLICVVNAAICLFYISECLRCRGWSGIPPFDLSSVFDLVICALRGTTLYSTDGEDSVLDQGFNTTMTIRTNQSSGKVALVPVLAPDQERLGSKFNSDCTIKEESLHEMRTLETRDEIQ